MASCATCGSDYDKAFRVVMGEVSYTFDSFECAIQALAPSCHQCGCKIIGHGVEANGIDCPAIDGIIEEAEEISGEVEDSAVLNAALVAAAQAAEHYEISRYGTLVAWAKQLGRNDCARVLQQNLDEEKAADRKLTEIAETRLNLKAAS